MTRVDASARDAAARVAVDGAGAGWRGMLRLGAVAAAFVALLIPLQGALFLLHPPPSTVDGHLEHFQQQPLLALLDLDLLLTLDYLAMIPFYLALFALLRARSPAWALLALVLGLCSLLLFFVSRDATFSMWALSDQYAAASTEAERSALRAAATTLLALYDGGTFALSYLLGAASTLLYSTLMLRQRLFGRIPGVLGLLTGLLMLVPPNVGPIGLTLAMVSLLPTAAWLLTLTVALLRATGRRAGDRTR